MARKLEKRRLILRRRHFWYVVRFSVMLWICIGFVLLLSLPLFYPTLDAEEFIILWPLLAIPGGTFFGIAIGIPLNRWLLVANSEYKAPVVPYTWPARYGRAVRGWLELGVVAIIATIALLFPVLDEG